MDKLVKLASYDTPKEVEMVPIETLETPSVDQMEIDTILESGPERESCMTP